MFTTERVGLASNIHVGYDTSSNLNVNKYFKSSFEIWQCLIFKKLFNKKTMAGVFEDSDLELETFEFTDENKVLTALSLLPRKLRGKFLQKMKCLNDKAFLTYVNSRVLVRSLVLDNLDLILPDRILSSLRVERKVINNPRLQSYSTKTFAVCAFTAEAIFTFVKQEYDKHIR